MGKVWMWRGVALLLFLLGLGLIGARWMMLRTPAPVPISGFTVSAPAANNNSPIAAAFGDADDPAAANLPRGNVYALPGTWLTADGAEFSLATLRGRPAVVTFVYTTCPDACPAILAGMERAIALLPPALRDNTARLALSFDPVRDTPRALAAMRDKLPLDGPRWNFLVPRTTATLEALSPLFGFTYFQAGEEFAHTSLVGVVNADGQVTGRLTGNLADVQDLATRLQRVLTR
ncbi:MAG: SCO family protein [Candidatus Lambdaproteobacteria bacterium]|nr:SCO family protein [Candidatus Lambdaproteobacteria bacterium]